MAPIEIARAGAAGDTETPAGLPDAAARVVALRPGQRGATPTRRPTRISGSSVRDHRRAICADATRLSGVAIGHRSNCRVAPVPRCRGQPRVKGEEIKTSISDSDLPTGPSRANKKLGARSRQKGRQLTE